jgi:pimeloyl-ACP methyl ester carboxylesterase
VGIIKQHDLRKVVLVGHSFGGSVISRVVEYVPDRIERLIFLDAFVLEDGQSVYDNLPTHLIDLLDRLSQASPDNTTFRAARGLPASAGERKRRRPLLCGTMVLCARAHQLSW